MGNAHYAEFCVVCTRTHGPFITPKLSKTSAQWMDSGYPRVNSATKGRAQTFISHTIRSILQVLIFGIALNLLTLHAPQWNTHLHSKWSILCIDHIRHLVCIECYFLVPHTHVLCMGSGSATGFFYAVRLVHSLLKYFFKFQLWYWIQIYTTKYSNLLLIILILVWIVCSTYRKVEILMPKWHVTSQFVYCYMPYLG